MGWVVMRCKFFLTQITLDSTGSVCIEFIHVFLCYEVP